jgi:uncharacterized DUF497 family protein
MEITYDPAKNEKNIAERGISFELSVHMDWETARIGPDHRREFGEQRYIAVGYIANRLHVLIFARTDDGIRVISLRRANKREVKLWQSARK